MFEKKNNSDKKLINFSMNDRCVPRNGYSIVSNNNDIGHVTSGTFSPNLGYGVGMGYVEHKEIMNNNIHINIRDKEFLCSISKGPFIKGSSLFE